MTLYPFPAVFSFQY